MTSDLLAGRKAQENQWVKDTQNFLAIETLLYIYGLQAMKSHERNQVTLEHFEKSRADGQAASRYGIPRRKIARPIFFEGRRGQAHW